jgi:hypothetical protein
VAEFGEKLTQCHPITSIVWRQNTWTSARQSPVSSLDVTIIWLSSFTESHPSGCSAILPVNFVLALPYSWSVE